MFRRLATTTTFRFMSDLSQSKKRLYVNTPDTIKKYVKVPKTSSTATKKIALAASAPISAAAAPSSLQDLHKFKSAKRGVGIGTTYTFTPEEIKRCYAIAKGRNDSNVAGNRTNCRFSTRDDVIVSFQGMLGEYALLKMYELDLEGIEDTTCRNYMNDSFDANLEGFTVDCKAVVRTGLDLIVSEWKAKNAASLFAMVLINGLKMTDTWEDVQKEFKLSATLLGLAPSDWVLKPENLKPMFKEQKKFYCWPSSMLVTWDMLKREQTEEQMNEQTAKLMEIHSQTQCTISTAKTAKLNANSMFF